MGILAIINAIHNGEQEEKYNEWKYHDSADVRRALAENGYYPEHFIQDVSVDVQAATLKKHPEYVDKLIGDEYMIGTVTSLLETQQHPNVDVLRRHVDDYKKFMPGEYIEPIELKLKSYNEYSPIEKTMTRYQLYKAGSPLWAKDIRIDFIEAILNMESEIQTDEIPEVIKDEWRKRFLNIDGGDDTSWFILDDVDGEINEYLYEYY